METKIRSSGIILHKGSGYVPGSFDPENPPENIPEEVVDLALSEWSQEVLEGYENRKLEKISKQLDSWRQSTSLSRRKFKIGEAVYKVNGTPLVELIEALLAGLPEPDKTIANISYNESNSFDRLDAFVVQFGEALGMTDEEVDNFFKWAEEEKWREEI